MGEINPPFEPEDAAAGVIEGLAKYLYEHYDYCPDMMRDDDPRNTGFGQPEPWETAGKRKREYWEEQARELLNHVANWFTPEPSR